MSRHSLRMICVDLLDRQYDVKSVWRRVTTPTLILTINAIGGGIMLSFCFLLDENCKIWAIETDDELTIKISTHSAITESAMLTN